MKIILEDLVDRLYDVSMDQDIYYVPSRNCFAYDSSMNGFWVEGLNEDEDIEDFDEKMIALPSKRDIDDYGIMEDFTKRQKGEVKQWLENAIRGRGAFRMFRATCDRFGITQEWYDFREKVYRAIAMAWCDEHGIEYERRKQTSRNLDEYMEEDYEEEEIEEEVEEVKVIEKPVLHIVEVGKKNYMNLLYLVSEYRQFLASLKQVERKENLEEAQEELEYYLEKKYPMYVASISGKYVGYAVVKIEDDVVWLESLYVRKEYRRQHIATALFEKCEAVAKEYGNETLYLHIHPNNDGIAYFLKTLGYDVLNLIEVRKRYEDEVVEDSYNIHGHEYKY